MATFKVQPLTHPTFCQRTLREINILSKLNHENVIELLDCFAEDVEPISEVFPLLFGSCLSPFEGVPGP